MRLTVEHGNVTVHIEDADTAYSAETLDEWVAAAGRLIEERHNPPRASGSTSDHERAATWDHDRRSPIGFGGSPA